MDVPADTISQVFLESKRHGDKAVTGQVMDVTISYVGGPTPSGTLLIDAAKIDFAAMSASPECRIADQPYVLADWDRLCE